MHTIHNIREKARIFRGRKIEGEIHEGHHVELTPGGSSGRTGSIRLFGLDRNRYVKDDAGRMVPGEVPYDRTFKIGDVCAAGSFNLVYFGRIEAIGPQSVTIRDEWNKLRRLDLPTFSRRNRHFDHARAEAHNAEELQCI